eukprot:29225-Pelagococcus_subviridis.AAC.10
MTLRGENACATSTAANVATTPNAALLTVANSAWLSPPTSSPVGSIPPSATAARIADRFGSNPGGSISSANGDTTSARTFAKPTRHPICNDTMPTVLAVRPRGPSVCAMRSS